MTNYTITEATAKLRFNDAYAEVPNEHGFTDRVVVRREQVLDLQLSFVNRGHHLGISEADILEAVMEQFKELNVQI